MWNGYWNKWGIIIVSAFNKLFRFLNMQYRDNLSSVNIFKIKIFENLDLRKNRKIVCQMLCFCIKENSILNHRRKL